ncbi:50S ribosomal protein L29 [Candidatus Saccharibacteria bacterium]|nr:MAG: 50S ribosomal protein L29 [Candidatus Saccharibacteria bacterium]
MTETKQPANAPKKAKPADAADLPAKLAELRTELIAARQAHRAGELVNPRRLRELRKDIARVHTAMNQKEKK